MLFFRIFSYIYSKIKIAFSGPTPVSISNSAKILETKCMKDNEEGDFANKPVATKPSEDNAEAKSTKKLETRSYKNKTEANPKKKLLPAISSKDKTEANLEKNLLHAESSEDKAEDNLTTKIEKVSSSKLDHKEVDCEKGDDTTTSKGHASSSNLNGEYILFQVVILIIVPFVKESYMHAQFKRWIVSVCSTGRPSIKQV